MKTHNAKLHNFISVIGNRYIAITVLDEFECYLYYKTCTFSVCWFCFIWICMLPSLCYMTMYITSIIPYFTSFYIGLDECMQHLLQWIGILPLQYYINIRYLSLSWVTVWYLCLVNRYFASTTLHESVFSLLFMTDCYLFCHQSAFCFWCIWIYNVSYCNLPVCYLYCTIILFYIISPVVYLLDTISLLSIHI
jgi:hypothetical protein